MKNIHILLTDKPSRLHFDSKLFLSPNYQDSKTINSIVEGRNIYITSDEKIKDGYFLDLTYNIVMKSVFYPSSDKNCKKIILTTDQDLIKDDVQEIDDEFLEWFVNNPSCEWVEVVYGVIRLTENDNKGYWISIPNVEFNMSIEEPKQETLEEVALNYAKQSLLVTTKDGFIAGAKWQAERMYSEEEVRHLMTLAFEQGFKKADIVEAGLEAKETDTEVNWIFLKHKK